MKFMLNRDSRRLVTLRDVIGHWSVTNGDRMSDGLGRPQLTNPDLRATHTWNDIRASYPPSVPHAFAGQARAPSTKHDVVRNGAHPRVHDPRQQQHLVQPRVDDHVQRRYGADLRGRRRAPGAVPPGNDGLMDFACDAEQFPEDSDDASLVVIDDYN